MDPVYLKVTSPNRMIPIRGIPVRTPCEIKCTNESDLDFYETLLNSQALNFERKVTEKPKKKAAKKVAPKKSPPKKKKVDATTPPKAETTLGKLMDGDE